MILKFLIFLPYLDILAEVLEAVTTKEAAIYAHNSVTSNTFPIKIFVHGYITSVANTMSCSNASMLNTIKIYKTYKRNKISIHPLTYREEGAVDSHHFNIPIHVAK